MGEYTLDQVVERAQVDRAEVERIVALGIVVPDADGRYSTGHVRRVRILCSLEESGLPLPGLAEALRSGMLTPRLR